VRTGRTDALLRKAPLDAAEQWLAERPDDLNSAERLFIGESLRERAARRRLVTVSAGVAAFLVVVVVVELLYSLAVTADWPRLPLGVSRGALYLTVNVLALVQVYRWFARYVGITTTPTSVGPARRPAVAIPIVLGLLLAGLWYIGTAWPDGSDAILPWGTLKISEYLSYQVTVMATVFLGLITFALMRSAGQWTDRLFAKFSLGFYAAYFATCALIVVLVILILIGVFPRFIRY
jgi:hypothetical protein